MNLQLPAGSDAGTAREWLTQLMLDFGPGFHLDTPPDQYVDRHGVRCFTPMQSALLTASLEQLFAILGDIEPYEIGAVLTHELLSDPRCDDLSR